MKSKRLGRGITKPKLNNNTRTKKVFNNKTRKGSARSGNVFKHIAPDKFKKRGQLPGSSEGAPGLSALQRKHQKSVLVSAVKSPRNAVPVGAAKSPRNAVPVGAAKSPRNAVPIGAAKSPRTAVSRKRSSSTPPLKKPSAKKSKRENGDVEIFSSFDQLTEPCDGNLSTISVQSGLGSTEKSLRTPLILDDDGNKSDRCTDKIHQQTVHNRSSAEKLVHLHKIIETGMPSTAESGSLDLPVSPRELDASNLDQSQGNSTVPHYGTFRPKELPASPRELDASNLDQSQGNSTVPHYGTFRPRELPASPRELDASNLDQSQGNSTVPHYGTFRPDGYENVFAVFSRSIRKGSAFTSFSGYCTVGSARKKLLVSMRAVNRLVIEGCYYIKPVYGKVRILGYTVHEGERRAVFSPRHRALVPVTCVYEGVSIVERSSRGEEGRSSQHQGEEGRSCQHHVEEGRSCQHQGEKGRSCQHQGEEGRSCQHQEEEGRSCQHQEEEGRSCQHQGEVDREAGVKGRGVGAPRPSRPPSEGASGGLGVVFTEEMVESLRSMHGLDDFALASLHLEIGVSFVVVELSSYRSRLPEVLRHVAVPSLVMDQHPGCLTHAPLSSLVPGTETSAPTNLNAKGPLSAVHYVVGTSEDGENLPSSSTDKCGPGLAPPTSPRVEPISDSTKALLEPNAENKPGEEYHPGEEEPDSTAGVGRPSNTCDVYEWHSVLGGAKPRIHAMGQVPFVAIPHSWWQAVQEFKMKQIGVEISGFRLYPKRRVIIIGDKGTGKSTFLKYFINSLLDGFGELEPPPSAVDVHPNPKNRSSVGSDGLLQREGPPGLRRAVCCLDLDPGQPEQSLPGSLSVCRYTKPLLGPAFTYSLASVKTSQELSEKKKIFGRRRRMVQQLLSLQGNTDGTKSRSSKFTDLTELLEDEDTLENTTPPGETTKQVLLGAVSPALKPHLYIDVVRELMETVRSEHSDEPLVVNTMGWLSELGLVLLLDIINIVAPTHVIHLTNDGRPELDCHYMNHLFREKQLGTVLTGNPIFNYDYFQVMAPTSTSNANKYNRTSPGPRDLRSLMFTSYFTALWPVDSTSTLNVTTCKIGVKLKYTDLAVYDLRFSDDPLAVLENMRQNRALVALCNTDPSNILSAGKGSPKRVELRPQRKLPLNNLFGDQIEVKAVGQNYRRMLIRQNTEAHGLFKYFQQQTNDTSKQVNDEGNIVTTLTNRIHNSSRTRNAAFEVHGWGIVVSVNTTTKEVYLLTPTPDTALPKTNTLVRCSIDLPEEFDKLLFQSFE